MTGVKTALENIAKTPPSIVTELTRRRPGTWAGRTRAQAVRLCTVSMTGAPDDIKTTTHAQHMHKPADVERAQSLYALRVKPIMKTDTSPLQHAKLNRAKAALLATLDDNQDNHAVQLLATRREAINMSCTDVKLKEERHARSERAMLATLTGPDTLEAALQRTGASRTRLS